MYATSANEIGLRTMRTVIRRVIPFLVLMFCGGVMTAVRVPQGWETGDSASERRQFIKAVAAAGAITMVSPTISQALAEKKLSAPYQDFQSMHP